MFVVGPFIRPDHKQENNVRKKKKKKLLHQVGDLFELYDDSRTYKS
jgi:hypothetical protein